MVLIAVPDIAGAAPRCHVVADPSTTGHAKTAGDFVVTVPRIVCKPTQPGPKPVSGPGHRPHGTGGASSSGGDPLPFTGSDVLLWSAGGFLAVAVGAGIMRLARRRR